MEVSIPSELSFKGQHGRLEFSISVPLSGTHRSSGKPYQSLPIVLHSEIAGSR
jgi:hypothetical protein